MSRACLHCGETGVVVIALFGEVIRREICRACGGRGAREPLTVWRWRYASGALSACYEGDGPDDSVPRSHGVTVVRYVEVAP